MRKISDSRGIDGKTERGTLLCVLSAALWCKKRQKAGIQALWIISKGVFGSYVRVEQEPDSDLDLLVEFHDPPGLFDFVRLENELSELLGVRVDLVTRSALKPSIGRYILDEVVLVSTTTR